MSTPVVAELLLRGAAASLALALALHWSLAGRQWTGALCGLFGVAIGAYMLVSTPATTALLAPVGPPLYLLATFAGVFLWWFLLSLFDDAFRFRAWYWIPFAVLCATLPFRDYLVDTDLPNEWVNTVHQALTLAMLAHGLYLALRDLGGDLVEPRRRFRIAFTVVTVATGVVIALGELLADPADVPAAIWLVHAATLFALTAAFATWGLRARDGLLPAATASAGVVRDLDAADRADLERLDAHMDEGAWRRSGLTIRALAADLGLPEHRLRRLINRGLGYRNFAAFLNRYRVEEAKRRLAAVGDARTPVLTIALDLGYGSIGPFNRAFKTATGRTPTDFRAEMLGGSGKSLPKNGK
ncbi:MAG: helix-turn-helix domain-containing protein [Woeseiaceae bacterium]|nr:helix-turn-helix domain-containing protein [Woeseiaceae bacterium]